MGGHTLLAVLVKLLFICPGRLRRYPAKVLNDLNFADDIALLEATMALAHRPSWPVQHQQQKNLGLIISVSKTEYMTANYNPWSSLQVYGYPINHVTDLKYLGSKIASAACDLKRCKAFAWSAFWKLESLWNGSQISISAKVKLFYTTWVTTFLYSCESWVLPLDMESKINAFTRSC